MDGGMGGEDHRRRRKSPVTRVRQRQTDSNRRHMVIPPNRDRSNQNVGTSDHAYLKIGGNPDPGGADLDTERTVIDSRAVIKTLNGRKETPRDGWWHSVGEGTAGCSRTDGHNRHQMDTGTSGPQTDGTQSCEGRPTDPERKTRMKETRAHFRKELRAARRLARKKSVGRIITDSTTAIDCPVRGKNGGSAQYNGSRTRKRTHPGERRGATDRSPGKASGAQLPHGAGTDRRGGNETGKQISDGERFGPR